jgi:protein-arginine kinase activator protein McsA
MREKSFEEFNELTQTMFINILEKAKNKYIRQQDYEMAAKMRDLILYEQMEDSEEKKAYRDKLIEAYKIK